MHVWSVAEAKSQLSEILRLARGGEPQVIGTQAACVVISRDLYEKRIVDSGRAGRWLIEHASHLGFDLEFSSRGEDRPDQFES
jgi:hypothetical protein